MEKINAQGFWNRVEKSLNGKPLSDVCRENGIGIDATYAQRLNGRIPKLKDVEKYSDQLGVSITWLLSGETTAEELPQEIQEIVDAVRCDPSKLRVVRVVLGLE